MVKLTKCAHKWKYCDKCHDWGCATDSCPNQIRAEVGGGLLTFSSYKCATCMSKTCSLCKKAWNVCDKCGDGGCSTVSCSKNRWVEGGFLSSGGCKTCKSGKCSCGNWTWMRCDDKGAGCTNKSCGKYRKC